MANCEKFFRIVPEHGFSRAMAPSTLTAFLTELLDECLVKYEGFADDLGETSFRTVCFDDLRIIRPLNMKVVMAPSKWRLVYGAPLFPKHLQKRGESVRCGFYSVHGGRYG